MSQPDYQPLGVAKIEALLRNAAYYAKVNDGRNISKIQVRLIQGIKGMEDPKPIDCPVADKENDLSKKYIDFIHAPGNYDIPTLARELHQIMEG